MIQIHRNLLRRVNKAKNSYKLKLALENGFTSVEAFKEHLLANLEPEAEPATLTETQSLIAEAKKRYNLGDKIQSFYNPKKYIELKQFKFERSYAGKLFSYNNGVELIVYENGKWAEIEKAEKPTIHIIYVQDSSASMSWTVPSKFSMAIEGITTEIKELKKDKNANYIINIIEFAGAGFIKEIIKNTPIAELGDITWEDYRGWTALNDTIVYSCELARKLPSTEKVLLKVFTDGIETSSTQFTEKQAAFSIKTLPKNVTFTFVGAKEDRISMSQYGIEESNILLHDNTSEGVKKSFNTTKTATVEYSAKVKKGRDVSKGFYKGMK
ncbi:MAG: hypothetical protein GY775_16775 [Candidatus Scalindua sp.]|nr:hypothetical protein [Candidatus Scalindua sp.]